MTTQDPPAGRRQSPTEEQERNREPEETDGRTDEAVRTDGTVASAAAASGHGAIDDIVEEMIRSEMGGVRDELESLERQVEEVENFARISLNERKLKQAETNLSEFSDSLTAFAEKAFNNINELESRLDEQALLLAAVLDALEREGIDVDAEEVRRQREESVVATATPEERLSEALEEL